MSNTLGRFTKTQMKATGVRDPLTGLNFPVALRFEAEMRFSICCYPKFIQKKIPKMQKMELFGRFGGQKKYDHLPPATLPADPPGGGRVY